MERGGAGDTQGNTTCSGQPSFGQREITAPEAGKIAAKAGLTCDFDECCVRQAHPLAVGDEDVRDDVVWSRLRRP